MIVRVQWVNVRGDCSYLLILVVEHHFIFVFSGFNVKCDCSCLLILVVAHRCILVYVGSMYEVIVRVQ